MDAEEALWHPVPRLDAPDRLWLLPAHRAKWLLAGLLSGPLLAQAAGWPGGCGPAAAWGLWWVWAVWLAGALGGALGAFWRPGGLHAGQWAAVLADFALSPHRATWRPVGARGGALAWSG